MTTPPELSHQEFFLERLDNYLRETLLELGEEFHHAIKLIICGEGKQFVY